MRIQNLYCVVLFLVVGASLASGQAIIQSGPVILGINTTGEMNVSDDPLSPTYTTDSGFVGLAYTLQDSGGPGNLGDATSPGCQCEGWGVAGNGISGWANNSVDTPVGTSVNLTVDSFTSTASTAVSSVHLTSLPGLTVVQDYHPAAAAPTTLFEATVTITNTTDATITDVRYTRVMDWDVPPDEFNEYVTIFGNGATNLLFTSDNGFASANPFGFGRGDIGPGGGCGVNVDFTDCGIEDHGALFDFGFGDLAAGESITFYIYYGAAGNELDALSALFAVDAEVYSLGQTHTAAGGPCNDCSTFIFGFRGVGGEVIPDPVPEPASMVLLGSGLLGLAAMRKRAKS